MKNFRWNKFILVFCFPPVSRIQQNHLVEGTYEKEARNCKKTIYEKVSFITSWGKYLE